MLKRQRLSGKREEGKGTQEYKHPSKIANFYLLSFIIYYKKKGREENEKDGGWKKAREGEEMMKRKERIKQIN
jgi:hypothetical protein